MDVKQIAYSMWVYEEKSFSRAARRAQVGQPTPSMQIRKIDEECGVQLFERRSRGVEPTLGGHKLYERCVPIALNLAAAESSLSASLLGTDVRRVTQAVFFISSALAAEAGLLLALRSGATSSDIGLTFGLKALMFVFGLGRLSELMVWAAMTLVLIVRTSGIFGSAAALEQRA